MQDKNQPDQPKRRTIIKKIAAVGTSLICAPYIITSAKAAPKLKLYIRTSGGNAARAYQKVLFEPFRQKKGIEIINVSSSAEPTAKIKTILDTKEYDWHMAFLSHRAIHFLGLTYLERHQLENEEVFKTVLPEFVTPYSIGMDVFTTVLAYRTDAFKGSNTPPPKTWSDFWNTKAFRGRRGLRKIPFDTIEEALLADGVLPNAVYPCDLKRAFKKIDEIEPHIGVWWQNAPEAEHFLKSGEVDLMPAFHASALSAISMGAPVAFSWDQHIYGYDSLTIIKDAPHADACREFIKFALAPERQKLLVPWGIGPTQQAVLEPGYLDAKFAQLIPTYPGNLEKGIRSNGLYWAKHQNAVIEQFNEWRVG